MDRFIPVGRLFFAIGLAGFGVLHFTAGDFVAGRAPAWPEALPGRLVWAYGSGAVLIGAAVAIVVGWKARVAALTVGTMIFAWALLRHMPVLAADTFLSGRWTQAGKALVFFGGAYAVAGSLPAVKADGALAAFINARQGFLRLGRIALGLFMIQSGIQHYIFDEFVASLVPAWIPGPFIWTYLTGGALIAGGTGLIVPRTARLAAALSGLMIFAWVWLVHVPLIASFGSWLPPFEALAMSGLALLLWRALPRPQQTATPPVAPAAVHDPAAPAYQHEP